MPDVFVITGVQASGKSTVAGLPARRFPRGMHVAGDAIRAMVVSGKADMSPAPSPEAARQLLLRYQASIAVARIYHEARFDVVIEDVIIGEMPDAFLRLLPWADVHLVVLDPAPEEIARRERERAKNAYHKGWTVDALHRILHTETPRHGLWLDTSRLSPEETVDAILSNRDASRLHLREVAT